MVRDGRQAGQEQERSAMKSQSKEEVWRDLHIAKNNLGQSE